MSKRGKKLKTEIGTFLRQYARKAQRGVEPNDRRYDEGGNGVRPAKLQN
jgi:hypothetical protein